MKKVAVLPGDGIGPEVMASALSVLHSVTDRVEFITADMGCGCYKRTGESLPRGTMDILDEADVVLMGTADDASNDKGYRPPLRAICKRLDLTTRLKRFYRLSDGMGMGAIDAFLVTENTDAMDPIVETETLEGVTSVRRIDHAGCRRLCRSGRTIAEAYNKEKITLAHDGEYLKITNKVLVSEFRDAMKGSVVNTEELSYIEVAKIIMLDPKRICFVVCSNIRGEFLDGLMTTVAGRGMTMPVACLGDRRAMFRPDHGPMPGLVGINRANPVAAILAGSAALDHIGMTSEGRKIRDAVKAAYGLGYRTADDGGDMGTYELTDRIISLCENAP